MGRMPSLLTILTLLPALASGATLQPASNRVESVTVFLDRAEVTRRVSLDLPAGASTILVHNLPAQLIENSLRASGNGPAGLAIAAVEIRRQFSTQLAGEQERKLRGQLQGLRDEKQQLEGRLQALDTRARFIEGLAQQPGTGEEMGTRPLNPEKWAAAWEAIGKGMEETNRARITLQQQQRELEQKIHKVEQELKQIQTGRRDSLSAAIQVETRRSGKADFALTYQLHGASWSPHYDAALDTASGKLTLTQAATIRQNTGEAWQRARITVSTARPSAGAAMPQLHPWWIDFARPMPLPEARMKAGRSVQADEMLAAQPGAAEQRQAQVQGSDFSVRYRIPGEVTVPADNSRHRFVLTRQTLQTQLHARTAPKLDSRAFLYASLTYEGETPLLAGPWQLQRDGTYVGSIDNPVLRPGQSLALAFGTDDAIGVDYKLLKDEREKQGLISREENIQRRYRITLTNHHQRKLPVSVFDQLPVSRDESIKVSLSEDSTRPSDRDVEARAGVLEWKRTLDPGESWTIHFGYDVRYPQDKQVPGF